MPRRAPPAPPPPRALPGVRALLGPPRRGAPALPSGPASAHARASAPLGHRSPRHRNRRGTTRADAGPQGPRSSRTQTSRTHPAHSAWRAPSCCRRRARVRARGRGPLPQLSCLGPPRTGRTTFSGSSSSLSTHRVPIGFQPALSLDDRPSRAGEPRPDLARVHRSCETQGPADRAATFGTVQALRLRVQPGAAPGSRAAFVDHGYGMLPGDACRARDHHADQGGPQVSHSASHARPYRAVRLRHGGIVGRSGVSGHGPGDHSTPRRTDRLHRPTASRPRTPRRPLAGCPA